MSLLESMYLKKLCLVNDVIGNRDVIKTGFNGYVCSTSDDFVRVIRKVLADPDLFAKIVAQAKKDIEEVYNTRIMASKYRAIYEEALSGKDAKKDSKKKRD